jgi:CubicO group peptidase (beta-lactamase class C family)
MSDALVLLSAGIAVSRHGLSLPTTGPFDTAQLSGAIAKASGRSFPQFLSRNVWQPLNAGQASWSEAELSARAVDWLRVAELLLHDGRFEGTQVVPSGWGAHVQLLRTAPGAEPFADKEAGYLRGRGATRLWLFPRFDLAVLSVSDAAHSADETRLPNMIVRALRERPGVGGTSLNDLVPGH